MNVFSRCVNVAFISGVGLSPATLAPLVLLRVANGKTWAPSHRKKKKKKRLVVGKGCVTCFHSKQTGVYCVLQISKLTALPSEVITRRFVKTQ